MKDNVEFIKSYLNYYRLLEKKKCAKEDVFLFFSSIVLFVLLCIFLENLFFFGSDFRLGIKILLFLLISFITVKICKNILFWKKISYEKLAISLEKKTPFFQNHLINAWQLKESTLYPESFLKKLKEKSVNVIQQADPSNAIDLKKLRLYRKIAIFSILIFVIYSIISPGSIKNGFSRMFFAIAQINREIKVEPGNCTVEKGSDLKITVYLEDKKIVPFIEHLKKANRKKEQMKKGNVYFSYYIPEVNETFSYRIIYGRKKTDWFKVTVLGKTLIKKLRLTYVFPSYTGKKRKNEEKELSEITSLYGTKITVESFFNNPVGDTYLIFGNGKIFLNKGKSKSKVFTFTLKEATLYQFKYYDLLTKKYITSPREKANVLFDKIPFLEFISPGKDIQAKNGISIPLKLKVKDDFGLMNLNIRYHKGEGDISEKDPVFYKIRLQGKKETSISATLKTPEDFPERISYYAECFDNFPGSPNTGRSSIYFIYPVSGRKSPGTTEEKFTKEEMLKENVENLKKELEKFIVEGKKIIEAAKKLGEIKDYTGGENLDSLAESEEKWAELFQKMVEDLNKLGTQTKGKFTLSEELVEMISHVRSSVKNLKKKAIHMAITESQTGLELAVEITSNLEKWLSEYPDYLKWDMEEPSQDYEVPEAELPDELEDIIGDLIEQEEDMREEIEDITSSWMDSLDKGAGWGAMDGPISNMSAKGITGNLMPNQQEIGGRSGEGRTGRSYGEMVEKTATGKGGRKTPARVTPDNLEPGQIQDTSGQTPLGPTGGGKVSGWGPEGLRGPAQDLTFKYNLLAGKQKKLIEKAEKLARSLKVLNIYNPDLEQSILAMKTFSVKLKEGRYTELLTTKQFIISHLQQANQILTKQAIVQKEAPGKISKVKRELGSIWDEKIPLGYEEIVRKYYNEISK